MSLISPEYDEILLKEEFKVPVNAKMIYHAIVKLYASTKAEVVNLLRTHRVAELKIATAVMDFWLCKTQHLKYLGLRLYFVGEGWRLYSILLGIRKFNPSYGERVTGIRVPFRRWIDQMLKDFDLSSENLFGGMSDAGPDVRHMLQKNLGLQWEWCIAHLSNAATKTGCGIVNNKKDSKNPDLANLIDRVCITMRQVRDVEKLGNLFEVLCEMEGKPTQLLDYRSHRFLGIARVFRRVLELWSELQVWYDARAEQARAENKIPKPFLIEDDRLELVQHLSILHAITVLNQKSQGDNCGQVDILLHLYKLRLQTLNASRPLRHYDSTPERPAHFTTNELTPTVVKTRTLLAAAFDKIFFSRYTDCAMLRQQSLVFEMQLLLFPTFKNLDANLVIVTRLCCAQQGHNAESCNRMGNYVRDMVINRARSMMIALAADEPVEVLNQLRMLDFLKRSWKCLARLKRRAFQMM